MLTAAALSPAATVKVGIVKVAYDSRDQNAREVAWTVARRPEYRGSRVELSRAMLKIESGMGWDKALTRAMPKNIVIPGWDMYEPWKAAKRIEDIGKLNKGRLARERIALFVFIARPHVLLRAKHDGYSSYDLLRTAAATAGIDLLILTSGDDEPGVEHVERLGDAPPTPDHNMNLIDRIRFAEGLAAYREAEAITDHDFLALVLDTIRSDDSRVYISKRRFHTGGGFYAPAGSPRRPPLTAREIGTYALALGKAKAA